MSKLRISCDDGAASDVRLAELAKKYDIDCIFYWPVDYHSLAYANGYTPLSFSQAEGIAKNFTLGSHTITHRHLTRIPKEEAEYEIEYSRYMLEDLFGVEVKQFCPPRGYTNDLLTEFTMKFYDKQRLTREDGLVHVHPNSGANNNRPWRECIDENTKEIWCHSWELDKYPNLWQELEEFLSEE
jgi:peptidoglycan/xylan/chitin deacetylase (PgdA/CDA1 family)